MSDIDIQYMIAGAAKISYNDYLVSLLIEASVRGVQLDVGTYIMLLHHCHQSLTDHRICQAMVYIQSIMKQDLSDEQREFLYMMLFQLDQDKYKRDNPEAAEAEREHYEEKSLESRRDHHSR